MRVTDNFQRANNPSLGPNWSTPAQFPVGNNAILIGGGMQLLNNAWAPASSIGGAVLSVWAAGGFASDQYAQAQLSAIAPLTSLVAITAASLSGGNTTYTYTLTSGSALTINQQIYITGMAHAGNNGNFQITGLGAGTFTVANASGVTATENGTGSSPSDSDCGLVIRGTADGKNGYLLYIGTNSSFVANGSIIVPSDQRTQTVEFWKVVNGTATFIADAGGMPGALPFSVNDVFLFIASGNQIRVLKNGTQVFQATDNSLTSGAPGIFVWSTAPPGEWATPTTWGTGNSGTQMTNWVGGDDANTFTQLASESFLEGTALTQVVSDNFQRANGGLGANWNVVVGGLQIVSNTVEAPSAHTRNGSYWSNGSSTFNNDQYAEAKIVAINNTGLCGPVVRYTGSGAGTENGYILLVPATGASGNVLIQREILGAATTILTIAGITPNVGDVFRLSVVGTTLTAFKNGVSIGSVTDANIASGFPGIFCFSNTLAIDCQLNNWAAGGIGISVVPASFVTLPNQNWQSSASSGASANILDASGIALLAQNAVSWPADQYSELVLTGAASMSIGPAVRLSPSADTGYFFIVGASNTSKLGKMVAGVITTFISQSYTFNAGDVFRVEVLGNIVIGKINGLITSVFADSSIASGSAGLIGLTAATGASAKNWDAGKITAGLAYSVPDCRMSKPSSATSRNVNGTLTYDVQTSSNSTIPSKDSRAAGAPVDCRVSPNIPQNSRTPGTYGPGLN